MTARSRLVLVALAFLALAAVVALIPDGRIGPGLSGLPVASGDDLHLVTREIRVATETVPASVEAREATIVASRLLARVQEVGARAGDFVEAGQLLVRLEQEDLVARAAQAVERQRALEARREEAGQALKRALELHERRLIADADLDAARAAAASLEAEAAAAEQAVREARAALSYAEIRSPIAGRVVERLAEPGDTVSPGAPLISVYNPGSLRIEASVRESLALDLQLGQSLTVEVPALRERLVGRVEERVPAASPGSRAFRIRVLVPMVPGLLPGMFARVAIPREEESVILVPRKLVVPFGQLDVAWVASVSGPQRRFLRLGEVVDGDRVRVIAGLEAGERLLEPPSH